MKPLHTLMPDGHVDEMIRQGWGMALKAVNWPFGILASWHAGRRVEARGKVLKIATIVKGEARRP
jgi:hypothetical protein